MRSGDAEEEEKPEIPEDACVRLFCTCVRQINGAGRQSDRAERRRRAQGRGMPFNL